MNHVCVRGAYLLGRALIPHMKEAPNPHVLNVAPAPIPDRAWMGDHVCYSGTKIGMGLLIAAWSAEFPRICFNSIWPMKMVATFAVTNTVGGDIKHAMNVASMADPAYRIVTSLSHSHHYLDNDVLLKMCRVRDVKPWQVRESEREHPTAWGGGGAWGATAPVPVRRHAYALNGPPSHAAHPRSHPTLLSHF